jgi:hypothetical protein
MTAISNSLPTFVRLFPNFQTQCNTLYTALLPVTAVLLVAGLVANLRYRASSVGSLLRPIITTALIVMAVAMWDQWLNMASDAMGTVIQQMDARPDAAAQKYVDILVAKENPQQKGGWFGLPSAAQMYEAVLWALLSLIGIIAQFIIWAAYILQQFLVGLAYAFAPVFLGFLALRSTSNIGVRYIMGVVGIIAWPLGWAAASIGTSNLIDVATAQGLVVMSNVYGLQTILAAAIIGGWIILTTLIAPVVIQHAIASGAQVGSALLGGALTAGAGAVTAGATTAATLGTAGVGTAGMLAGATASAGGSLAGSTMQGSGPPMSGSMFSHLLPWWMAARSYGGSNGNGATSSSAPTPPKSDGNAPVETPPNLPDGGGPSTRPSPASRSTASATSSGFDPSDPANNQMVDEMIDRSKRDQHS